MSKRQTTVGKVVLSTWVWWATYDGALAQVQECATVSTEEVQLIPCIIGGCDRAANRDAWNVGTSTIPVRVKIHVFDWTIVILSQAERDARINGQVNKIRVDFRNQANIDLQVTSQVYENSPYASVGTWTQIENMKNAHAQSPATQLNVYVSNLQFDPPFRGVATLPWHRNALGELDATTAQGGIVIDGSAFGQDKTTLTHEIGHSLGLWHTYHGNSQGELNSHGGGCNTAIFGHVCDCVCFEPVDPSFWGNRDCNLMGDFCCDTLPTLGSNTCGPPTGPNSCPPPDNWGFGPDYMNFMDSSPDGLLVPCRNNFTVQQAKRQHCWTCDKLTGWIAQSIGTCCTGGTCSQMLQSCCVNHGGTFFGAGMTCEDCNGNASADVCEAPIGACCVGGTCSVEPQTCCSGFFIGEGTTCDDCNLNGAPDACEEEGLHPCCLPPNGPCVLWTDECCWSVGGAVMGQRWCTPSSCDLMPLGPAPTPGP